MGESKRKKQRRLRRQGQGDNTLLAVGVGVVVVAAAAAYFYFRKQESTANEPSATERIQAMTGFVPATFNVSAEEQAKLDAWQPPPQGVHLTARAEAHNSRRAAERAAALRAAAEAARSRDE